MNNEQREAATPAARLFEKHGSRIILLAVTLLGAGACSLILPHPSTSEEPSRNSHACSLELDRNRQFAACETAAAGAPTMVIIRLSSLPLSDPAIHDRSIVEFTSDQPSTNADRSRERWRIDVWRKPSPRPGPRGLSDGDLIYLWNLKAHRYLRVSSPERAAADARHRSDASIFALYKADVINPNRPSTCDALIRDGDYAYIRALEPSTWFHVSDAALEPAPPQASGRTQPTERTTSSAADQRCRTDERDQLLCGWVAQCLRP